MKFKNLAFTFLLLALLSNQHLMAMHQIEHLDAGHDDEVNDICEICITEKKIGQDAVLHSNFAFLYIISDYRNSSLFLVENYQTLNKPFQSHAPPYEILLSYFL